MRIVLGCDHGGYCLKEYLKTLLEAWGHTYQDHGCESESSVDYPDFAMPVATAVAQGASDRGILICTTGMGMCIVANKVPGVRAALCYNADAAELSRRHNDANILILAAKYTDQSLARDITQVWLTTDFEKGRHERRLNKIREIEKRFGQ